MASGDGFETWTESVDNQVGSKGSTSPPKVVLHTKKMLTKQAGKIAKQADEHEQFLNKVTYSAGVVAFGTFCYLLGSRPQDIPYLYCFFFLGVAPLRWIYYRIKKWHYYLLDFCYYANAIFMTMLLFFPNNDKLFLICFSFAEGPLAWALIVWRCSLVFSSIDKIVSVLIHLLPGTVFFIIRWWDPVTFSHHSRDETGPWPAWPLLDSEKTLWTWLFVIPLIMYSLWQMLYFLVVNGLRRQRLLNDPEIMTSYRELSRKAAKANNIWWRFSGILGEQKRVVMYAVLQAVFTVATMALTVPMFKSYRLHTMFEVFKLTAAVWNGGNFFFEVMPRQVESKKKKKAGAKEGANGVVSNSNGVEREVASSNHQVPDKNPSDGHESLVKSSSSGDVRSMSQKLPLCALCKRTKSLDLSQLMSGVEKEDDVQPFGQASSVALLRRRSSGCASEFELPQGAMDRFDRTVYAN